LEGLCLEPNFPLFLVLVPLLGVLAQWLAWRIQLPSILLLLVLGICLGFWLSPDKILAEVTGSSEPDVGARLLFPIVSLSVAVILFEGGLTLRWNQLGTGSSIVFRLIGVSSLITWGMTAVLAHYVLGFAWPLAGLLGAILLVTGPTVVGPLLRQIRPNRRVSSVLHWEGILIDPIGALAAVLVFELISQPHEVSALGMLWIASSTLFIGSCLGAITAVLLVVALRRYWIPDYLQGVFFLVAALAAFYVSNALREESGLVTVTVLGICLANQPYVSVKHVLEFKEHLRVLLISCLFIVLGSRLHLSDLAEIGWVGIPFVLILVFIIRPLSVYLSMLGNKWEFKEKLFVGLVAPRGIVAASVASVFGLKLVSLGEDVEFYAKANLLAPMTFMVILGTVTMCGLGAAPLARRLGLSDLNPQGILFAGASRWVREVAVTLRKQGIQVMLIDTNFANVTAAKLANLNAKCESILSEQLQEEQDLAGLGKFLAVTPSEEVNALAGMEYAHIFSKANIYQLAPRGKTSGRLQSLPAGRRGRTLFQNDLDHQRLETLFDQGAIVKSTTLTASFTLTDFRAAHGPQAIILFAIDAAGRLKVMTAQDRVEPVIGDRIISIVPPPQAKPAIVNEDDREITDY
jgi:NhaP-type Na+/H+ or K+/H+ antiporter